MNAYKLRYSDYPGTDTGPPDPERWVGPPGPPGPPGQPGDVGPPGLPGGGGIYLNVLDFGADPTGVADSSSAINTATALVGPNGRHGTVYLPTGTYRVNRQINLTASQGLIGDTRGSSILYVDQAFSPTDTAVVFVTSSGYDAGPVLRDFGISFAQPQDQGSRANFKTLAAGGTSGPGGSGVKYPWAIASGSDSTRIQITRVRIAGAWDGITSNGHNTVFSFGEIVEMGALDCGVSLGEGSGGGIQDFVHIAGYHFWNFGFSGALFNVFADGQTIAMRVGRADGIDIRAFDTLMGRLVVTPEAGGYTGIQMANCVMDTDQATIEVNGDMTQFSIANMSGSAGTGRFRPLVQINASCNMNIANHYSQSSSPYQDFLLNSPAAILTVSNFRSIFYSGGTHWAEVRQGLLRLVHGYLYLGGPQTVSAIAETLSGALVVDDVTIQGANASGPLISAVTNNTLSWIGSLGLQAGNTWTFSLPAGLTQVFHSPHTSFTGEVDVGGSLFANGNMQLGSPGGSDCSVVLVGAAGNQKAVLIYRGGGLSWALTSGGAAEDLILLRYDNAGVLIDAPVSISRATGLVNIFNLQTVAFGLDVPPVARQTVTGSRGGNAALASLLTKLAAFGLITDSTSA